jgi:hypothetical protein
VPKRREDERLEKQVIAYKRLLRMRIIKSGMRVSPDYLIASCGIYTRMQADHFFGALEKGKWAR